MQTTAQMILVVDDNPDWLHAEEDFLIRKGYSTLAACGGIEALEKSRAYDGHIALLLTGVSMPEMDGITLAEHVLIERPGTRILVMSAGPATESRFPLLMKPFDEGQLLERVAETLTGPVPLSAAGHALTGVACDTVEMSLQFEVNELLHRYLQSSRAFLEITRDVPSGIPNPDGIVRLQKSAQATTKAFEEYRRAQRKLDDHRKGRLWRTGLTGRGE